MQAALSRQYVDLMNVEVEGLDFATKITKLVNNLIDRLISLEQADGAISETIYPRFKTSIGQGEEFIDELSAATHATIVGLTNVDLEDLVEKAIKRKRRAGPADAFWTSIRVVFASEAALRLVHDELDHEFASRDQAIRTRLHQANLGRRAVGSFFLRASRPGQWAMYEYPFLPPFVGAFLEMPDGSKHVRVATLRPSYSVSEYLFLEFSRMGGEVAYYQAAFEDIVGQCVPQDEVTLVGVPDPTGRGFYCHMARFRRAVLSRGNDPTEWLPTVQGGGQSRF